MDTIGHLLFAFSMGCVGLLGGYVGGIMGARSERERWLGVIDKYFKRAED